MCACSMGTALDRSEMCACSMGAALDRLVFGRGVSDQQGNSMRSRLNCWPKVGHWLHNAVCLSSHTHTHTVLNNDRAPRHASTHDVNAREREHTLKKQANDDEQIDFTDRALRAGMHICQWGMRQRMFWPRILWRVRHVHVQPQLQRR